MNCLRFTEIMRSKELLGTKMKKMSLRFAVPEETRTVVYVRFCIFNMIFFSLWAVLYAKLSAIYTRGSHTMGISTSSNRTMQLFLQYRDGCYVPFNLPSPLGWLQCASMNIYKCNNSALICGYCCLVLSCLLFIFQKCSKHCFKFGLVILNAENSFICYFTDNYLLIRKIR